MIQLTFLKHFINNLTISNRYDNNVNWINFIQENYIGGVFMKKSSFVAMILGTIGSILFALGMCMCLLPEWNAFNTGVILGCIGLVILLAMIVIYQKMEHTPPSCVAKQQFLKLFSRSLVLLD